MSQKKTRVSSRSTSTPAKEVVKTGFPLNRMCDRLKYLRIKSGKTFAEIEAEAKKLTKSSSGFSKSQIHNDERYDNRVKDLSKLVAYSMIYKCSLMWLLEYKGLRRPDRPRSDDVRVIDRILARSSKDMVRVVRNLLENIEKEINIKQG